MVQVTSNPSEEKEPILGNNEASSDSEDAKTLRRNSCAEEAYKNIASSMMADPIEITNPIVAQNLFETALRVRNVPLAKHCITILNNHIEKENVLQLFMNTGRWLNRQENEPHNFEPSAPPIVESDEERTDDWMIEPLDNLRRKCLGEIDKHGDHVLKQKDIVDLSYYDLLTITTRDTLMVSTETVVYSAIMRWCMEECKRRTLQPQLINIKAVLRDLVYAPRYGLMSKREFLVRTIDGVKGPDRIGILDEMETNRILEYMKEKRKKSLPELPFKGSQERRPGNSGQTKSDSACEKVLINCLTCWTVVFD